MHKSKTQTKHTKTQEQQCVRTQTQALTHTIMHALTHSSRAPKHREKARESKRNILAHFVYLQRTQIVTAQGESEWNSPQPQTVCNNWPLPPLSGWLSRTRTLSLSLLMLLHPLATRCICCSLQLQLPQPPPPFSTHFCQKFLSILIIDFRSFPLSLSRSPPLTTGSMQPLTLQL